MRSESVGSADDNNYAAKPHRERNAAKEKSRSFAIRIIKLYKHLCSEKNEFVISKQILRSGTSIGANIAEADYAISKKEFLTKLYISLKETSETLYWLDILHETEYLTDREYESLKTECEEIRKILSSSTKTAKERE